MDPSTIDVSPAPSEVTVFSDRARTTRRATSAVPTGLVRLRFLQLPTTVDGASLRASAHGTARARLLGVTLEEEHGTEPADQEAHALREQVEELEAQLQGLTDAAEAAKARAAFTGKLAEQLTLHLARSIAYKHTPVEEAPRMGTALRDDVLAALSEARAADLAVRRKQRELDARRADLELLAAADTTTRCIAVVALEVSTAGELTVELSCTARGARWEPTYDVRVDGAEPTVAALEVAARVTQETGEPWTDVRLALSTARPALATVVPELSPWALRVVAPPPRESAFSAKVKTAVPPAPMMAMDEAAPAGPVAGESVVASAQEFEATADDAAVDSTRSSRTFVLAQVADVPSDGAPHTVHLGQAELPLELRCVAVPVLAPAALRRVSCTNSTDAPLLGGDAQLFVDGDFIGTHRLEHTPIGGTVELTIGVEETLTVERELVDRGADRSLLGGTRHERFAYAITLKNGGSSPRTVEVRDHYPLAADARLSVERGEVTPDPREETELHELIWERTLAPGAEETLRFGFTVASPTNTPQVLGLPT